MVVKVGDVFKTNEGYTVTVVDYLGRSKVFVEHGDEFGHISRVEACQLKRGTVKNPFHRSVYGVGFVGVGKYVTWENGKHTDVYNSWKGVIERGYSPKFKALRLTYSDVTVCDDWHNFQVFAEWWEKEPNHDKIGFHLDKDLRNDKLRQYSPESCSFVPHQINTLLNDQKRKRGEFPQGVSAHGSGYRAFLCISGERSRLGTYKTPNDAFKVYEKAKLKHVKYLAGINKVDLHPEVYDYLMNWEIRG